MLGFLNSLTHSDVGETGDFLNSDPALQISIMSLMSEADTNMAKRMLKSC